MDALFGLPRKKSAGCSYRDPLHGQLFFAQQNLVDEYVATYTTGKKSPNVRMYVAAPGNSSSFLSRFAVSFSLEMRYGHQRGTMRWMRLLFLDVPVGMNSHT